MERKNAWKKYSDEDKNNVFTFADEYKTLYLSVRQKENV